MSSTASCLLPTKMTIISIRYGRFTTTTPVALVAGGVPLIMMMVVVVMMMMIGCLPKATFALNSDGFSLLALKAAVSHDPHQVLAGWGERDGNPCGWEGVSCSSTSGRVTELVLPDKGLTGYIPSELGFLLTLRRLSLPHNNLSNPIPTRLLAIPALASLDLSHNSLTGPIPNQIRLLSNLTFLDLSSNALSGPLPPALAQLPSLAGTLNLSYNRFSGPIPTAFASFPLSLSLDLRHNNLSGPIPQIGSLLNQGPTAFAGNPYLCGFPLQAPACSYRENTTPSAYYNLSRPAPTPAASGGKYPNPTSMENSTTKLGSGNAFPKITILAGGMALILMAAAALVIVVLLVRRRRRRRRAVAAAPHAAGGGEKQPRAAAMVLSTISTKTVVDDGDHEKGRREAEEEEEEEEEDEEVVVEDADYHYSSSSSSYVLEKNIIGRKQNNNSNNHGGELRVLDEGFGVVLEELLRASAYVVGKSRSGIVYKVVVGKGVAVAVRRLSELGHVQGRMRSDHHHELEAEVEAIGRVRHPNLVRLRAYYFAPDERLLVSDFIPNGTLHSALHAAGALTTPPLPWTVRLKIAQGAARGIAYIHEFSPGKYVHGSIKSSKLLLGEDHQPYVSGFGLAQLISCARGSTDFVRKRQNSFCSAAPVLKSSLPTPTSSSYSAPEARGGGNGHTQKCDVYAFGIVLLEILTGRMPYPSSESNGMDLERFVRLAFKEERPLSDIVDPLLLHEVYAKKQVLATFHIALGCTEANPEARPRMKAVSECLERIEYL